MISLLELTLTGRSGGLEAGISASAAESLLGPAEDSTPLGRRPRILRFGSLELSVDDDRVVLIAFYRRGRAGTPAAWRDDLSPGGARDDVLAELSRNGAWVEPLDLLTYDEHEGFRVAESGAVVGFTDGVLDSVQLPGPDAA